MRILYVTTVSVTMGFFPAHIKMLQEAGYAVELACNMTDPLPEKTAALGCLAHHIPFSRSPFSKDNLIAYKALKQLLAEDHYDIVHTHTPNASALVRLAIDHSRNTSCNVLWQHYLLRPFVNGLVTHRFACSPEAGQWVFGGMFRSSAMR